MSTGDIFRRELENESKIGKSVQKFIKEGQLVPDEIVIDVLFHEMHSIKNPKGFIFDGFPRNRIQAEKLKEKLESDNLSITSFIALEVEGYELIQRMLKRGKLNGRIDDKEKTILNRLDVYKKDTLPLIDFYMDRYKFNRIDGMQTIDEVFEDISTILNILVSEERLSTVS